MRRRVLLTRVAIRHGGVVPSEAWTASRLDLLALLGRGAFEALGDDWIWVWLVDPARSLQVLEHPVSAHERILVCSREVAPGLLERSPSFMIRLDSDDAFKPDALLKTARAADGWDDETLVEFPRGWQLDLLRKVAVSRSYSFTPPFCGITAADPATGFKLLDVPHTDLRTRYPRIVSVQARHWLQVCHDGNILNRMRRPNPSVNVSRMLEGFGVRGRAARDLLAWRSQDST